MRIQQILRESIKHVLFENITDETRQNIGNDGTVEVDNFKEVEALLDSSSPDDVWYIFIVQREKDNPGKGIKSKRYIDKYYLVHDAQELMQNKNEIMNLCIRNNARAYITANKRSMTNCEKFAQEYIRNNQKYGSHSRHRGVAGREKQFAYGRSFPEDITRDVIMIDIDSPDKTIHKKVHEILDKYNVKILMEYPSLNDGLHIFTKSQEEILNVYLSKEFLQFDGGKDLGILNTVGIDFDRSALLYASLKPQGYRGATNYSPRMTQMAIDGAKKLYPQLKKRHDDVVSLKKQGKI